VPTVDLPCLPCTAYFAHLRPPRQQNLKRKTNDGDKDVSAGIT